MAKISDKVKKPGKARILGGLLKNDIEYIDPKHLREKIHGYSSFGVLYFAQLLGAVLICSLGLLIGSPAIVIGGMLIAPLMWPLARIAYGASHKSAYHIYRGLLLLVVSIFIGFMAAFFITYLSPIKIINAEILSRTAPTLIDLFIALVAGFIALVLITQKKIADSFAGVAIAASLLPPLCVAGIALSLKDLSMMGGALLLFAVNAACIILVLLLGFIAIQRFRREVVRVDGRALLINILVVLVLAIPLLQLLRSYSFEAKSYTLISQEMNTYITSKSPSATFENIEISEEGNDFIKIKADLYYPGDSTFSYEDSENISRILSAELGKDVILNLRLQNIYLPVGREDSSRQSKIRQISSAFEQEIGKLGSSATVSSLEVSSSGDGYLVKGGVILSPGEVPRSEKIEEIRSAIEKISQEKIKVEIDFVPRLSLKSGERSLMQTVEDQINTLIKQKYEAAEVEELLIRDLGQGRSELRVEISYSDPDAIIIDQDLLTSIKNRAISSTSKPNLVVELRVIQLQQVRL